MKPRVAINGFGRIGRQVCRRNLETDSFELVAINDLSNTETMAHMLKYDSNYGVLDADIEAKSEEELLINGKSITVITEPDPLKHPWKELEIDVVVECTGVFRERTGAQKHIEAGAKKVVVSAPGKELDFTVVLGVNDDKYEPENHHLISNASCTTNCLAPFAKILNDKFEIEKGLMTTIHSFTTSQRLLDMSGKDLRRSRAAGLSLIPTTTGAAKAVGLVLPELDGKLNGMAIRVPTPTVSLVDLTCMISKDTSKEELNATFKEAAQGPLKGILGYDEIPLVSIDYKGNPLSSIIDGLSTEVMGGKMVKILSWYDNEWGYSSRVVDLVKMIGEKM